MSIVVVGGGAIGLLVAGELAAAKLPVGLLARESTRRALAGRSLHLVWPNRETLVERMVVATDPSEFPAELRRPAHAILCVKGYDTPGALPGLAALDPAQIITLQNGIGNEAVLIGQFGSERVISGAITTSVDLETPARIKITKAGGIGLALTASHGSLAAIQVALSRAGFTVKGYANYEAMKWSKALLNMLGNASAAILDLPVATVYSDRRLVALERRAFREALAVMDHHGWRPINLPRYPAALLAVAMRYLPPPLLDPILRNRVAGGRGGKAPSLLRDMRAGRARSEGEFLYGAIAKAAAQAGLPAPVNAGLWRVLAGIASGAERWERFRQQPDALLEAING